MNTTEQLSERKWHILFILLFTILLAVFFNGLGGKDGSFFFLFYPLFPVLLLSALFFRQKARFGAFRFNLPVYLGILSFMAALIFFSLELRHRLYTGARQVDYRVEITEGKEKIIRASRNLIETLAKKGRELAVDPDFIQFLVPPIDQSHLFAYLEKILGPAGEGTGISVYGRELRPLAWSGYATNINAFPAGAALTEEGIYFAVKNQMTSCLIAVFPIAENGGTSPGFLVLEKLLAASYSVNNRFLQDFDILADAIQSPYYRISIQYLDAARDHQELDRFFKKYEGNYWGRTSSGLPLLRFPLVTPPGTLFASATLEGLEGPPAAYFPLWYWPAAAGILFASFFYPIFLIVREFLRRGERGPPSGSRLYSFAGALILIWGFRVILQKVVLDPLAFSVAAASPENFYLYGIFDLFSSPLALNVTLACLLLTLCVAVLYTFKGLRFPREETVPDNRAPGREYARLLSATLMAVVIAQCVILYYCGFVERILKGTRINLAAEALFSLPIENLLLRASLSFLFFSVFLFLFLLFYLVRLTLKRFATHGQILFTLVLWFALSVLVLHYYFKVAMEFFYLSSVVAALLAALTPGLAEQYWKLRRLQLGTVTLWLLILSIFISHLLFFPGFFALSEARKRQYIRDEVIVWFKDETARKKECLWQILKSVPRMKNLRGKLIPDEGYIAYSVWSDTSLPARGYDSGLAIFDVAGNPVSRFTLNTPLPDAPGIPGEITVQAGGALLAGTESIGINDQIVGYVTTVISLASDNVHFMISGNPYKALFRSAPDRSVIKDLPGVEPALEIFSAAGDLLFSTEPLPQFLDTTIFSEPDHFRRPKWIINARSGRTLDTILFLNEGKLIALSFPRTTPITWMTSLIDLLLLSFLLLLWLFFLWWLYSIIRGPERLSKVVFPFSWLVSGFYRKLFVTLVFLAVIPMLFLSYLITNTLKHKIEADIEKAGFETAVVASQIVRDFYLESTWDEENAWEKSDFLSDDLAHLISNWIEREVNIFINERLVASSTRELFSSGLLPDRLDGLVFREIVLNRRHHFVLPQKIGAMTYQVVNVPLDLEGIEGQGVLAIPMHVEGKKIAAEVRGVQNSIFVLSSLLTLIASIAGFFLSNRISRPVKDLVEGTEDIARGNFDVEVTARTKDEIRTLVESFQTMAVALKEQRLDLQKRSEYIEKILINVTTGVISIDTEGFMAAANPAALELLELDEKTLRRERLLDLLLKHETLEEMGRFLENFQQSSALREVKDLACRQKKEDCQLRVVFTRLLGERDIPTGTLILMEDVSDVVRSNRLAAWAEMARIIAHEIKNPLTPIQLALEHLVRVHEDRSGKFDTIFKECTETIMKQVQNLRRISGEFSSYARLPKPEFEEVDSGDFLKDIFEPYHFSRSRNIEIKFIGPASPLRIHIDAHLMKRAFTNIIENAMQAMPDGGLLEAGIRMKQRDDRNFALFTIRDNGHGIDEETFSHLFDPYFSTKKSGIGLGLAIVKRTIEDSGGIIEIESEKGKGTTVYIYLPITERLLRSD